MAAALALAVAPATAQTFEAVADTGRLTVGDPVAIRLILRQYEGDALLEQVPHPEGSLDNGVRLLSVDSMRPIATRLLEARAHVAFYRPGAQTLPPFAIDFRRGAVILHGTMRTAPLAVEIAPVLETGSSPRLRDIKEIVEAPRPDLRVVAMLSAAAVLAAWSWRRLRRRAPLAAPALATVDLSPPEPDAYARALDRLRAIESSGWTVQEVARHYEAVADALRDYLSAAEALPARRRTSSELVGSLPPHLGGLRARSATVFGEADLVKFARRRPDAAAGAAFLASARDLLHGWRDAARAREADALR